MHMPIGMGTSILLVEVGGCLNLTLLEIAADDINTVLRKDCNVITRQAVHLLDKARELLLGLDKKALLGLLILTQKSRARGGVNILIKKNGLIQLNGNLGCLLETLGRRKRGGCGRRSSRGTHF